MKRKYFCLEPGIGPKFSPNQDLSDDFALECSPHVDMPIGQSLSESLADALESGVVDASLGVLDAASMQFDPESSEDVDPTVDWRLDRLQRAEALQLAGFDKALRDYLSQRTPSALGEQVVNSDNPQPAPAPQTAE